MQSDKLGTEVPTWTPELGSRLAEVYTALGGLRSAASIISATDETLANWRDGRSKMPLLAIAALAAQASKSLDWIVYGTPVRAEAQDSGDEFIRDRDIENIRFSLAIASEWLDKNSLEMNISDLFDLALKLNERTKLMPSIDEKRAFVEAALDSAKIILRGMPK